MHSHQVSIRWHSTTTDWYVAVYWNLLAFLPTLLILRRADMAVPFTGSLLAEQLQENTQQKRVHVYKYKEPECSPSLSWKQY